MNSIYDCKVGDIVMTGDSYGMDLCVCTKERHESESLKIPVVEFLCLTTGAIHESGSVYSSYEDDCHLISRISKEEVDFLREKWKNEE